MSHLKGQICVFTGSRVGARADYSDAARELARVLVQRGYGLVYGGGNIGLMGVVADTADTSLKSLKALATLSGRTFAVMARASSSVTREMIWYFARTSSSLMRARSRTSIPS